MRKWLYIFCTIIFYHKIFLTFYFILATIHYHYYVFQSAGFIALRLLSLKICKSNLLFLVKLGRKVFYFPKVKTFFIKKIVYITSTALHINDDKEGIIFSNILSLVLKFELRLSAIDCPEYMFLRDKWCLNEINLWRYKFTFSWMVYFILIAGQCFLYTLPHI